MQASQMPWWCVARSWAPAAPHDWWGTISVDMVQSIRMALAFACNPHS